MIIPIILLLFMKTLTYFVEIIVIRHGAAAVIFTENKDPIKK